MNGGTKETNENTDTDIIPALDDLVSYLRMECDSESAEEHVV